MAQHNIKPLGSAVCALRLDALVFDCEIANCIPEPGVPRDPELQYAEGWHDFQGMGLACVCAFDFLLGVPRVFLADNLSAFQALAARRTHLIGFNSQNFDDKLLAANGVQVATTYDLLREVRLASGQPGDYVQGVTRAGYNLGALALANLNRGKTGHGATAPALWQRGQYGQVIDYCLSDIALTCELFARRDGLYDPTDGRKLRLRELERPEEHAPLAYEGRRPPSGP